jgi:phage terminase large subunit GpA-like protein
LRDRAAKSNYTRGTVPKGALLLFLGIDCQIDRVEWVLLGCGEHYRRYIIDIGTIGKHVSEPDAQRFIDQLLARKWPNGFGRELPISLSAIDANYWTDDVIAFVRKYSSAKLIAVRGRPGDATPRIARVQRERDEKRGTLLQFSRRFFNLGVDVFKFSLYRDLAKDDPEAPGYVSFPRDLPDRFFQELTAESRVAHKRMGQIVWRWEKPERQANEILDCTVYASAAALKYGVNWISDLSWRRLYEDFEIGAPSGGPDKPRKRSQRLAS